MVVDGMAVISDTVPVDRVGGFAVTPLVLGVGTAVSVVALSIVFWLLVEAWNGRLSWRSLRWVIAVDMVGWTVWMLVVAVIRPQLDGVPIAVAAALAGFAAVLLCVTPRMLGLTLGRTLVIAGVFTAAVFSPVAIALFSLDGGVLGSGLATLDLGGALPVLVTSGAGSAAILLLARRVSPPEQPVEESTPRASATALAGLALVTWLLWLLWLVGMESAIDEATPRILVSGVVAPLASLAVWMIAQRAVHATTTMSGAVGGLVCGLACIVSAAAYLEPVGAVLTGGIAGAVCSLVGSAAVRRTGHRAWMPTIVLLVGAGLGTGLLGLLAARAGLIVTGQPEVIFSQFASVGLVVVWAFLVTGGVWMLAGRRLRGSAP